jgi:hypothetical protein
MSQKQTKNDIAWKKLFEKYKILANVSRQGKFKINASLINEFREARLMTKFDHQKNLPALFKKNELSILPVTRGDYIIASFDAFKSIEQNNEIALERLTFPEHIQSIDHKNITSEATAINCAYISGILGHFLAEENLLPTVSGRMSSGCFDFEIAALRKNKKLKLEVRNSQIEIDGGFEGSENLILIEAKNSISSDFLIRQLYYPFRLWQGKIRKKIKPVFLIYSNGIYYLYEYLFESPENYNSLILVKHKRYTLETDRISHADIHKIHSSISIISEPKIPFPQADSFERVINLCELLFKHKELSKDEVTTTYDFDQRQTDYYTNAGRYLGLIDKKNKEVIKFTLTDEGKSLFKKNYKDRQLKLVKIILRHAVFARILSLYLQKKIMPDKIKIVEIMKSSGLYKINRDSTFSRRASTIIGWLNWILGLPE